MCIICIIIIKIILKKNITLNNKQMKNGIKVPFKYSIAFIDILNIALHTLGKDLPEMMHLYVMI